MSRIGLCLEPLDVLFFRDGRPFGAATRAESGLPMPQTLAGALRTALLTRQGFRFEDLAARLRRNRKDGHEESIEVALRHCGVPETVIGAHLRGPFLAQQDSSGQIADVLIPAPAVLYRAKGGADAPLNRLEPLGKGRLPGWRQGLRPLWLNGPAVAKPAAGYLTRAGQEVFLQGGIPERADLVPSEALFDYEHRTGIEILPDPLTAKEGGIYGASFLALRPPYSAPTNRRQDAVLPGVVLYAEIHFPGAAPAEVDALDGSTLPLGGEGRRVAVRRTEAWAWPSSEPRTTRQKPLLLLTTPGLFPQERWRPTILADQMVAAAVPGALPVSGWDLARNGPKPNRFAAAAGGVYFLETIPDNLPEALSDEPEDRVQGWGCYLKGVWNDG